MKIHSADFQDDEDQRAQSPNISQISYLGHIKTEVNRHL